MKELTNSGVTTDAPDSSIDSRRGPEAPRQASETRWRDGPLFVSTAFVVALISALLAAACVAIVFAVLASLDGERSPARIVEAAQSATATWIMLIVSQAVTLAVALLACRIIAAPRRKRLGLASPTLGPRDSIILLVATIVPFVIGLLAASVVPSFGGDSAQGLTRMWSEGTRTQSVLWVLTIALIPGMVEEIFYRGLVLRGLLMRWRPLPAILVSSAFFAIAHLDPAHAAFTFVVGVWFGVVAWRTGSIVLPILMHAGMNGSWTTIQMIAARDPADEVTITVGVASAITITVGAAAFVWAILVLRRGGPGTPAPRTAPRSSVTRLAVVGGGLAAAAALLLAILPPGAIKPGSERSPALTASSLRGQASATIECPSQGEAGLELRPGETVRVALPANRVGVQDVIVGLDASADTLWLAYDGAVSGKNVGIGVVEQLRAGDPTTVLMRHEAGDSGLKVWFSLLQDQAAVDAAWARAASEDGWATRGRR